MDMFSNLSLGFGVALSLQNIALCFAGCLVGTLIGVLPGVGPIATIAILRESVTLIDERQVLPFAIPTTKLKRTARLVGSAVGGA